MSVGVGCQRAELSAAAADQDLLSKSRTLLAVDDEVTTGRTLANLSAAYRQAVPALEHLVCATVAGQRSVPVACMPELHTRAVAMIRAV